MTQSLMSLEREIGSKLVNRSRSGVTATVVGQLVAARAHEILGDLDRLKREVEDLESLRRGEVRVGVASIIAPSLVARHLANAKEQLPQVRLSIERRGSESLWTRVATGELDVALARMADLDAHPDLAGRELLEDRYVVWARSDHLITTAACATKTELRKYPWVFARKWQDTFPDIRELLRKFGKPMLEPTVDSSNLEVAAALIAEGDYLSVWPRRCFFDSFMDKSFTALAVPWISLNCSIGLMWRARRAPSPAMRAAIEHLSTFFSPLDQK